MALWNNVYHGFMIQWSKPTTWIVLLVTAVGALLIGYFLVRHRRWPPVATSAALACVCAVTAMTWRAQQGSLEVGRLWGTYGLFTRMLSPEEWRRAGASLFVADAIAVANVLFFVPVGFFLMLAARRLWLAVSMSLLLVMGVETQQALRQGVEMIDDVLANTLGAAVGIALAALGRWMRSRRRPDTQQRRLAWRCHEPGGGLTLEPAGRQPPSTEHQQ